MVKSMRRLGIIIQHRERCCSHTSYSQLKAFSQLNILSQTTYPSGIIDTRLKHGRQDGEHTTDGDGHRQGSGLAHAVELAIRFIHMLPFSGGLQNFLLRDSNSHGSNDNEGDSEHSIFHGGTSAARVRRTSCSRPTR